MSKVLAKDVNITLGGKKIAGATDANINLTTVFATSRTKADKRDKRKAIRVDWTGDSASIIGEEVTDSTTIVELRDASKKGTKLDFEFSIGSLATYKGKVLVSNYTETAPKDGRPTCSATFKSAGKLSKVKPEEPEEPEGGE